MQLEDLSGLMTLRRFVEVAHHIPGRIRLRFTNRLISGLSKNKLSALEEICHPEGYLRSYSLNTATGSLVLEYSAAHISPATLNQLFGEDDALAHQALEQIYSTLSHSESK
ncbi:HMA2 domain-containing protein [Hafnia alvei]|uniref:HMA2 domain-containing protein n=1 Tax=Hafnia TaxID=568 RepID=UPI001F2B2BED|nr:hypothetical protein [Hafnia alvei]MCE9870005.1 hypothetical protein [Hafnia alvei]MDN6110472.1 hypothetical protein [Enterobacterales bacterium]